MVFEYVSESCYYDIPATIFTLCLGSIAYGLHLAVAGMTCYFAAKHSQNFQTYYIYIGLLLLFSSANYILVLLQFIFGYNNNSRVLDPLAWAFDDLPKLTAMTVTLLCNAFLMYRCFVVWNAWKPILILPTLILLGIISSGLVEVISHTDGHIFTTVYWPLLLVLNVLLSALICGRILWLRNQARKLLGKEHEVKGQTSIIALVVESSLMYTSVVAMGGVGAWAWIGFMPYAFSPLLVLTECIASELIILRVVLGCAVTQQWATTVSTARATTVSNETPSETR